MHADHPAPFATRWRAKWIWHGRPRIVSETATRPVLADPVDRVVLARRELTLDVVPERVPARIWSDGRYVLRVNGTTLARGPVRSDPRRAHYDCVDLAGALVSGPNVIAVVARHFGKATSWWMPVPPTYALGAGSVLFEAEVGADWVVSDRTWRTAPGRAWSAVPMPGDVACLPLESFDARAYPVGWDRPGFDASGWAVAHEIVPFHTGAHGDPHPPSEPFGAIGPPVRHTFPDGATHPAVRTAVRVLASTDPLEDPVAQVLATQAAARDGAANGAPEAGAPANGDPTVMMSFDLGHIAAGTVELTVRGAPAGTVVDLAAAEHLDTAGGLVTLGQHAGLRYVAAGEAEEHFESLDIIGARHLHVAVRGADPQRPPEVELAVHDRHRPRPAGATFTCSDPALERIWEIGLRTVDLCALDAYVDCPTREQRAWTGDSVVHQMVDLVTNPDWSMPIWHPQLAAAPRPDGMIPMTAASDFTHDDRTFVPDWSLHWVRSVHNLFRYTGERDLIAPLLPVVERTLRWFEAYLDADGLLTDVTGWALLDWASVYAQGSSSTMNALWARALEDLAEMADWLGNQATAAWARSRYDGVRRAFDRFWDDERGVYVDHTVDGVVHPTAAQHGGAAALAAGIVPSGRHARVIERLTDRSRLIRHSWAMDSLTPEIGVIGFMHLVVGYPEPEWDVREQMVEAEPFFRYVLHDGIARAGRADLVAGLCRDWQVFVDAGETSWPECWVGGTHCHGWSSTPTRDLIVHTLGIQPAEPGYAAVRVRPALGGLEWARATVPSPHGPITVEAHADGRVEVDSPVPVVRG